MIPFVELSTQFEAIESEIRTAIDRVLASGWFVLGKELSAFEQAFADYVGLDHAVGVGSGTDAIHLALRAVGVQSGDEVITVAHTAVPTVVGICASGATPVLVDIDPDTYTMDPNRLVEAITPKTRAIVPVHLYGHPCDMDAILAIANENDLAIVEDCAQAHGARYRERRVGTFGAASAFSFYPSKNLGAYGDGGAVVTRSSEWEQALKRLRNYGESTRYHHVSQGFNSRLDELQAAILTVKLQHLDAWNQARVERAALYREILNGLPIELPHEAEWATHCYHLFVIRTPRRDELREYLQNAGIGTQLHFPLPVHLQEGYTFLDKPKGSYPNAERAAAEVLSLPMYPELRLEDVQRIGDAIKEFFS